MVNGEVTEWEVHATTSTLPLLDTEQGAFMCPCRRYFADVGAFGEVVAVSDVLVQSLIIFNT